MKKTLLRIVTLFTMMINCAFKSMDNPKSFENDCSSNQLVAEILSEMNEQNWINWIDRFSGEVPVEIGSETIRISTRFSNAMFFGNPEATAFNYAHEQVLHWASEDQIEIQSYAYGNQTWKNLIVNFPGKLHPQEVVILSAHLDSISSIPWNKAPGADDNGSGAAALMEAVRVLSDYHFERTIRVIWFTGEEQGLLGSKAYVRKLTNESIVGVVNLDMISYDANDDHCFELHVGDLPASEEVGNCLIQNIGQYGLDLQSEVFLGDAIGFSDHASFWNADIGAVLVTENLTYMRSENDCKAREINPAYHQVSDQRNLLNSSMGFDLAKAGVATVASLAVPLKHKNTPVNYQNYPVLHFAIEKRLQSKWLESENNFGSW
ncbi:MAG: M20/M25/M40 family metallo-hydrolase [Anaerolineaceae bacterium]|nr:M20/M25/M40 family metallo-hydrolase [Anaerolineaceae bacterium]